jgi:hypothetical protein
MAFWGQFDGNAEPKRQHRWTITFTGALQGSELANLQYALKKVTKPNASVGSVTHKYLNHFFHYPGRLEWKDITLTFASIAKPDATRLIQNVLINAGYGVPTTNREAKDFATIGKAKFAGAVGTYFTIDQLNPDGDPIETWRVYNPFFTEIKFGDLDYENENIVDITCTVKYDWAELKGPITTEGNPADKKDSQINPTGVKPQA